MSEDLKNQILMPDGIVAEKMQTALNKMVEQGNFEQAEQCFKEMLRGIHRQKAISIQVLSRYAALLKLMGRPEEAERIDARVRLLSSGEAPQHKKVPQRRAWADTVESQASSRPLQAVPAEDRLHQAEARAGRDQKLILGLKLVFCGGLGWALAGALGYSPLLIAPLASGLGWLLARR